MKREPDRLIERVFDVIVVGGGIHGACAAMEAAARGLSVALLERGDFGCETSHNSLKLIHGGFRYLQHFDLARIRQSIRERRYWLSAAPHLCRPLAFLMPLRGYGTRSRGAVFAALKLYDLIAADRNRGVAPDRRIPSGRIIGKRELYSLAPGLRSGYSSGAVWYDGQMLDADRLLLNCVMAADASGCVAVNYVDVASLMLTRDRVVEGVYVRDRLDDRELEVRGRHVVLAAGPWNASLLKAARAASWGQQASQLKNMNLVVPPLFERQDMAFGIESRRRSDSSVGNTNRLFFVTPWQGLSVIGTTHEPFEGDPSECEFGRREIEEFLSEFNDAFKGRPVDIGDVLYVYGGLTPAVETGTGVGRSRRSSITDHAEIDGIGGLWSIAGVKFTTARGVAEEAIDAVSARLGNARRSTVITTPLPGAEDYESASAIVERLHRCTDLDERQLEELLQTYGSRAGHVLEVGGYQSGTGERGLLGCRARYALREEMAVCVDDLLYRRTNLAATGRADSDVRSFLTSLVEAEIGNAMRSESSERLLGS